MPAVATREEKLFINGEWTGAVDGKTYQKRNPYTGGTASKVPAGKRADARRAVEAAAAAFPGGATPPASAATYFSRPLEVLESRQADIARLIAEETGGTFGWGMFNCMHTIGLLKEAAAQAYGLVGEVIPSDLPDTTAMAIRQPVGVVVGIAPWNAPLILGMRAVAMPVAYGNTVVLKASEESPGVHLAIASVFEEAGFPKGVVNAITNAPEDAADVVDELIAHPKTRRINFTGSTRVGRIIAEKSGAHLKRAVLELGGKAPLIVLEDASIDDAVSAANFGAFMNQGQICMSTERIVVEKPIADQFAQKLAARAGSHDRRRSSRAENADRLHDQCDIDCARAILGGRRRSQGRENAVRRQGPRNLLSAHRVVRRNAQYEGLWGRVVRSARFRGDR